MDVHVHRLDIIDSAWRPVGEHDPYTRLLTTVSLGGRCDLHLEAVEVNTAGGEPFGVQELVDHPGDLDSLIELAGAESPFETYETFGRTYIVYATPYCG